MPDRADLLFGQIAVERGFLDAAALERVLEEQAALERQGKTVPLGELLLERGLLEIDQVDAVLSEQEFVEIREEDKKLGALAVRNRFATRDQVDAALARQQAAFDKSGEKPERLGALLVQAGVLTEQRLESLMRAQTRLQRGGRASLAGRASVAAAAPVRGSRVPIPALVAGVIALAGLGIWLGSGGGDAPWSADGAGGAFADPDAAELADLQTVVKRKDADLAALRGRLEKLRARKDPSGKDPAYAALAQALDARANDAGLAEWRKFVLRVEQLRYQQKFIDAIALLDEHAAKHGDADAERRRVLCESLLADARQWLEPGIQRARKESEDGSPEDGIARLGGVRDRLPAALKSDIDAVVEELRLETVRLAEEGKALGIGYGGVPDRPPESPAAKQKREEAAARRTATSAARLAETKTKLAERRDRRDVEEKGQALRAIERTTATPFDVEISSDYKLSKCKVKAFGRDGVTLETRQVTMPMSWESLPAATSYELWKLSIDEGSAEAQLSLGKFCVVHDLFDAADRHFKRAQELAPAMKARTPDTQVFRNRKKLFRGSWKQVGRDMLRLHYDFTKDEELQDFATQASAATAKGFLELTGKGAFFAYVRELTFSDLVTLDVAGAQQAGAVPIFGFLFQDQAGREAGFLAVVSPDEQRVEAARVDERGLTRLVALEGVPADSPVEVRLAELRIEMRVRGKQVWSGAQSEFSECRVVVGGVAEPGKTGTVRYNRVRIEGKAGPEWVRKTLSRNDTLALRELEDDLKGLDTAGTAAPRTVTLSVEEGLAKLPEAVRKRYEWAKARIEARDLSDPAGIITALHEMAEGAPDFAGGAYYAGRLLDLIGAPLEAEQAYGQALEMAPSFAEALGARAACRLGMKRTGDARADVDAALKLAPDLASAWYVRGRIEVAEGKREEALRSLELANALDPGEPEIRMLWKGVRNVQRGPLWTKSHRAETTHVAVRTDVNAARAAFYAQQLEACLSFYASTFGIPVPGKKVDALVFETQEGYQTYAELTIEDRVESTLGYYHPLYDQLLLFEDRSEGAGGETLRVLYHEGFHQFIQPLIPHIPFWLNEGLAEYFGASEVKDGKVVRTGLIQGGRLVGLQGWLSQGGRPFPFDDIMQQTPGEFYSGNVPLKYAQAWAMIRFFMQEGAAAYRPVLQQYVDSLRAGDSAEVAYGKSFEKIDLRRAEREWLAAVGKMKAE